MKFRALFIGICLCLSHNSMAAEKTSIHIGVQASGTVDWELTALQQAAQTETASFKIDIQHVANPEAAKIALQSGAVDMIVSDWIWVSRMRANGTDFSFYPYSDTSGALVVPENSPIHSIADLKGKRLGVAGGELDKNWLLMQALAQKSHVDLNKAVAKTFAAPPLISEQLKQNRIDAALTYWNFAVKLEAQGYREVIDGAGILKGLGINETVPVLGYVFKQSWADSHKQALLDFFAASKQAKQTLCTDDNTWQKILPLTQTDDAKTQAQLRQRYCAGSIDNWGPTQQQAAEQIYSLLYKISNKQLTGDVEHIQAGTFWSAQ
ncbi:MAG: ABC transporter substrate-binding protein [Methylococcales bacterium]